MNESVALCLRVLSTALFDWGLACACGLLLAAYWLHGPAATAVRVPSLLRPAALMAAGLACQFYVLVATMTDETGPLGVLRSAIPVASTHAGSVTLWTLGAACLLLLLCCVRGAAATSLPAGVQVGLLSLILLLHSAMGHAAKDGNFSRAELLQFLHLSGMALWTGGVIVSGLLVAPRLAAVSGGIDGKYLQALSGVSTYSLGVVLLTGTLKGWSGLDGQVGGLVHTAWGRILLLKLAFVGVAVGLGFLHRLWIGRGDRSSANEMKTMLTTLRIEAVCLTLVIVISAWLAGVSPAGE